MGRKMQAFGIKFPAKNDREEFERSPFGKSLRKKYSNERRKLPSDFKEYLVSTSKRISQILKQVEPFAPEEVYFEPQRRPPLKFQVPTKGAKRPDAKTAAEKSDEEATTAPEPVKKIKTQYGQPIIVEIYQKLRQFEGDLDMVIDQNPEYGDRILTRLDYFEKIEKRVQSKIRHQILQEWMFGIKFNETNVREIKQSLKDKSSKNLNIKRELFLEKEYELRRLEMEKGPVKTFGRDEKIEEM